eukprot:TRINITY_DN790_c4_g1_i2.p1 TRINITY_DN790_c4_g1~~TRINITY_DN790_c4_g1_i2.p1  ORF type:complete len:360 (+),score=54.23 TRINITY_DN790_c4_g1_i2:44-1123(+)
MGWDSDAERFDEELTEDAAQQYGNMRSIRNYKRGNKIARGAYGDVYAATGPSGEEVAIKFINLLALERVLGSTGEPQDGPSQLALREIANLKEVGSRENNILPLLEVLMNSSGSPCLVFPKMDADLSDVISSSGELPLSCIQHITHSLLTAVTHCHSHNVMHRDIKPANILLSSKGEILLTDFGMSRDASTTSGLSPAHFRVTLSYRAPECLLGKGEYGKEVDIWGIGATVFECYLGKGLLQNATGEIPALTKMVEIIGWPPTEAEWPGYEDLYSLSLFVFDEAPPMISSLLEKRTPAKDPTEEPIHTLAKSLIMLLLTRSPFQRPTASSLKNHKFLNWDSEAGVATCIGALISKVKCG